MEQSTVYDRPTHLIPSAVYFFVSAMDNDPSELSNPIVGSALFNDRKIMVALAWAHLK